MKTKINTTKEAESVFKDYPKHVLPKMYALRQLIIEVANDLQIPVLEETLKWGEPSFVAKGGSTIRMDWKAKSADFYALFFICSTRLVETFREVHGDIFKYEKNRAIIFHFDDQLPTTELKSCIKAALDYKKVKDLPFLGM